MLTLAAVLLGGLVGFFLPGFPLGFYFASSGLDRDAALLGPLLGSCVGSVVGARVARRRNQVGVSLTKILVQKRKAAPLQFGVGALMLATFAFAVLFALTRWFGFRVAAFLCLSVGGTMMGRLFGEGLIGGTLGGTISGFAFAVPQSEGASVFSSILGGLLIGTLTDKIADFINRIKNAPSG